MVSAVATPSYVRWASYTSFVYGAVLVVVMSRIPVEQLWYREFNRGSPFDPLAQAIDSWIMLFQIPAVVLLFKGLPDRRLPRFHPTIVVFVLLAFLLLSTIWSPLPARTSQEMVFITVGALSGCYLALNNSLLRLTAIVFTGLQLPILASIWASTRGWGYQLSSSGAVTSAWQGIYPNRNFLAPAAAIAVIAGVSTGIELLRRRAWRVTGIAAVVILVDLYVLVRTENLSSLVALTASSVVVLLYAFAQSSRVEARMPPERRGAVFGVVSGVCVLGAVIFAVVYADRVSSFFGRSGGFTRRTTIWRAGWEGFLDRPINGWGWMSAWFTDEFRSTLPESIDDIFWSHSFWIDISLAGGLIGIILTGLALGWGYLRTLAAAVSIPGGVWLVAFPTYALIVMSGEALNYGFQYLLALLVATFIAAEAHRPAVRSTSRAVSDLDHSPTVEPHVDEPKPSDRGGVSAQGRAI